MAVHQLIGAGAVVFRQIRDLKALGEVKPQLLAFGQVSQNTGVKQQVVVIRFAARHGVCGGRSARGNGLLLRIANKIIDLVFRVLIAHAAAQGDRGEVVATLQERGEVSNAVARIASYVISFIQLHPPAGRRFVEIEELLVSVKGFMLGIHTPCQRQRLHRLAVDGELAAVEIGFLLRRANAGDPTAGKGREGVIGQALIAVVNLGEQILAPEIGIGILQVNQVTFGAGDTVGVEIVFVIGVARARYCREVLAQIKAVLTVRFTFVILGGELQLLMIVDIQRAGAHHVQTVRVLQTGLGVIDDHLIAIAIVPAAKALISH